MKEANVYIKKANTYLLIHIYTINACILQAEVEIKN